MTVLDTASTARSQHRCISNEVYLPASPLSLEAKYSSEYMIGSIPSPYSSIHNRSISFIRADFLSVGCKDKRYSFGIKLSSSSLSTFTSSTWSLSSPWYSLVSTEFVIFSSSPSAKEPPEEKSIQSNSRDFILNPSTTICSKNAVMSLTSDRGSKLSALGPRILVS